MTKICARVQTFFLLGLFLLFPVLSFVQASCGNIVEEFEGSFISTPILNCGDPFNVDSPNGNIRVWYGGLELIHNETYTFHNVHVAFAVTGSSPFDEVGTSLYRHDGEDYIAIKKESQGYFFSETGTYSLVVSEYPIPQVSQNLFESVLAFIVPTAHAAYPGATRAITFEVVAEQIVIPLDPLLERYAPILYMHPDEDYVPMNVEAFVAASALWDDRGILSDQIVKAYDIDDPVTIAYLATITDTEDHYLAFSDPENSKSIDLVKGLSKYESLVADGIAKTTFYARKMEDSYQDSLGQTYEFIVLQYWYFYAMNNWKEHGGFNDHEGDWESVFIFLDKDTEIPKYVAFSAHHNDGENERFNLTQYGSVRRTWFGNEIERENDHVKSYVALGAHANYPKPGDYIIPSPGFSDDNIDKTSASGTIFAYGDFAQQVDISIYPAWLYFEGKWGTDRIRLGEDGPQGPNFLDVSGHRRFHKPLEWASIDTITEVVITEPESTFDFSSSNVRLTFNNPILPGNRLSVAPYLEPMTQGIIPTSTQLLPAFWDIESTLENGTFNVEVRFTLQDTLREFIGTNMDRLRIFWFNPQTSMWEQQVSVADISGNYISFRTNHFSRYALGLEIPPVISSPTVSSDSRSGSGRSRMETPKDLPTISGTLITIVNEEQESGSEQHYMLVRQILDLVSEFIKMSYEERGYLTTKEKDFITDILNKISLLLKTS